MKGMEINDEMIDSLAFLARLEYNDQERASIKKDLERILGFVDHLNELDTDGVEPLVYLSDRLNNLRSDEVIPSITHEEAMKNAPDADSDYFKIPKVIRK
jgi:aspartyl-tRNA(Asn)/glutamyl-tRNA(Gln) amidotransferase subunit C